MTPEYTVMGLMVAGMSAVFLLYQRGMTAALASKDQEIARLTAKATEEVAWLRAQNESWGTIARTMVSSVEQLTTEKTR